jgi:hypothetical protein
MPCARPTRDRRHLSARYWSKAAKEREQHMDPQWWGVQDAGHGVVRGERASRADVLRDEPAGLVRNPLVALLLLAARPRHPNAPQLERTGEITVETADRAQLLN